MKLSGIVVELPDGSRHEFTIEEAQALHKQLDRLFGDKTPTVIDLNRWKPAIPQWHEPGTLPCYYSDHDTPPHLLPEVWCKS